jgi:hypothetical protein
MMGLIATAGLMLSLEQAAPLYQVQADLTPAEVPVGKPASLTILFKVSPEAHISPDAPLALRFTGPDGVTFSKPVLHYKDAVSKGGPAPRFEDSVTASSPGTRQIDVAMSFYVCTKDLCDRKSETRHLQLTAK